MNVDYLYQGAADDFVDELGAGTAVLLGRDQSTVGRIAYRETSGFRTMTSSVVFGAIQGPHRDLLLARYVNFLLHGSGVEEQPAGKPAPAFRAARNPVRRGQSVSFLLPREIGGTVTIFDAAGRGVSTVVVSAGSRRAEVAADLPAGTYVARLTGTSATCAFSVVR